ncbi:MAG: hypothetical protein QOF21_2019 [Actinomycetota bacterium]
MQTLFPTKPSPATVVLLAASVLLAVIGIGGVASGAADDDSDQPERAATVDTDDTTTTSLLETGATTTLLSSATTAKATGTTVKKPTATTSATPSGECTSTPASANPGAEQPPAIGTFTYVSCTDPNESTDIKIAEGQSGGGVTRREITVSEGGFMATTTTAFGAAGIIQEKLTIKANGLNLECDWNPDIVEFPADLSIGKSWSADSKCTTAPPYSITIHATGTRRISDRVAIKIAGTSVNAWVVNMTLKLDFSGPSFSGGFNETGVSFFDPTRGLGLYDKSTFEGYGAFQSEPMTTERHIKSLTPS